ncbi:Ig-like domain-containing protein [Aquimarina sp. D1M17]|uniref:Ig-like domain-containing protein n=1 Tax=Aquimarina acroporae TaxID=2937283 RepID=UPI0020C0EF54|nr:Ig-like domain-containing protein [Aquimarina acroporae]MCK8524400.1 Ig-like domain-containing protein [Aquimarina acroporae]
MKNYSLLILMLLLPILMFGAVGERVVTHKDSVVNPVKKKDTTTSGLVNTTHLSQLQQKLLLKKGVLGISSTTTAPTLAKKFRAFPKLDAAHLEEKPFMIPVANRAPEFNKAYLEENFSRNPKADTLVKKAKAAFDAIKQLENFVEVISGKELLELPVGLSKKDSTSGNRVELAITEVKFLPKYAEFNAWARLIIPVKSQDGKPTSELYFGAEGIKLSNDGAIIGDMKLVLLGDTALPINGDNWLLTLKGDVNLKTGAFGEKSYVEFDCTGLKSIGLEGDLRVSRNVLLPIDDEGNYVCGDSKENQYVENTTTVDNKCYVGTSFKVNATGWNDLLLQVSLPRFEVVGFKGWGFHIEQAVLDLSDSRNADNLTFPEKYEELFPLDDRNLWRGVYAKEVEVLLPQGIEKLKQGKKRVAFGAQHLIIDSYGISGSFYGKNVLQRGEGAAGQWGFSIDSIGVTLEVNSLKKGVLRGDIKVPIMKSELGYKGWIAPREYGLEVTLKEEYNTPVFLGKMQLEKNSSVAVKVKEKKVYPFANLTGSLSIAGKIGQDEGTESTETSNASEEKDSKAFSMRGVTFQELELNTEPGKKVIQAKYFGYDGDINLMLFPATIKDLQMITPATDQVGLSFDLVINLDEEGSHATTGLQIIGKLAPDAPVHEWRFHKVKIDEIEIDYEKGGFELKGGLKVMEDDPTYGDGFTGNLMATFNDLNFTAEAKAMFGSKDFRYWFVDVWTDSKGGGQSKLLINSFVGGLSNRMRKVSGNPSGFTPSEAVYEPDERFGLGLRAGVEISTQNADAFSGKAYLEMEYNTNGGLNRIGFTGEGAFMSKGKNGGVASKRDLTKLEQKINDFARKNPKLVEELMKYGNYLGLSKKAIPKREIASQGKIGVYVGIERDFVNGTFDGEFELYMKTTGVRGGGPDNFAGFAKIHTGPDEWYLHVGTPQRRLSLVFSVGSQEFEVGGYFMTGTQLPDQLDPHPRVVQILGSDLLNGNRKEGQLQAARGFAFGLSFTYRRKFEFLIFYASLEVGAGFDVMHAYYPNAKCRGRSGPVGNDGWYSMGQIYAYLYGEFGVQVDLFFIKGRFKIAEAGIAAMLRGQFPNPAYFQGYVGMYYSILGGLVSGRMRLKVDFGEECVLESMAGSVGVPIISDISPSDGSNKVDVFTAPQAVFNYQANKIFRVETDENIRFFKLQLKDFTVSSEGKNLEGTLEWNDTNDAVTFLPRKTLPSQKKVTVTVEVSFEERVNGTFQTLTENGKLVTEKQVITFTTEKAPDYIPWSNITYLYPVKEQKNFHPEEYEKGYVKLKQNQDYLFQSKYNIKAEFKSQTGMIRRTDVSYDIQKAMVHFTVPEMDLNSDFVFNLNVFPAGQDVPSEIVVEETEITYDEGEGDTSWYDPASGNTETVNTSGTATIANKKAANVKVANAAPKSILDYTFRTSKYATFKEKVQDFSTTNHVTNFIQADIHSLSIEVANYEVFDKSEITGNQYTASKSLIYAEAKLKDSYYKRKVYPLIYQNYPLDGDIRVNRDEAIMGVPPIRSFYIGNEFTSNYEDNPSSYWVKNRIPFVYNLPHRYKLDMVHLRNQIVNRYVNQGTANQAMYNRYEYLIETPFPPLPLGDFKAQLIYRTPGDIYSKGYEIKYSND